MADAPVSEAGPFGGGGSTPLDRTSSWRRKVSEQMSFDQYVLDQAKAVIQEWVDKQGHDRCWYYPELFRRLVDLFGIKPTVEPCLPPRGEFKGGCKLYQIEEFGPEEKDPDTVVLKVTLGLTRRKGSEDMAFDDAFNQKVADAVNHLLLYWIGNGLTKADIQHQVMPDYNKTKVESYGEGDILQTVQTVKEDPDR